MSRASKKPHNKYNMRPHQIDRALQLRLSQGLPGGELLVLSRTQMERRVRQCINSGSPYPILYYYGWTPTSNTFSVSSMWKEEVETLREFGIDIQVNEGYGWSQKLKGA